MADKTYINGVFLKEVTFNNGGSIINMNINVEKFIQELKAHEKNGYTNIKICKRREADAHGNTHYAELNTYQKPENNQTERQEPTKESYEEADKDENGNDDLPF